MKKKGWLLKWSDKLSSFTFEGNISSGWGLKNKYVICEYSIFQEVGGGRSPSEISGHRSKLQGNVSYLSLGQAREYSHEKFGILCWVVTNISFLYFVCWVVTNIFFYFVLLGD